MRTEHWIPIKPQIKERPRLGRRRKAFTPEKTAVYERFLKKWWNEHGQHFDGPLYVGIEIHLEGIKIIIEELEESVRPVGVLGDLDNYQKSVWDGLQDQPEIVKPGVFTPALLAAFKNDKQIEWAEIRFVGVPRKPKKQPNP